MGDKLIKKKSNVHGIGIFTTGNFVKNTAFYKVPMKHISNKPLPKCAYLGKNRWVSDKKVLNYINHSCVSNSKLDILDIPKLISKKSIKAGEEITVDYNKTEKNGNKVLCNCKSPKCKKYFLRIV